MAAIRYLTLAWPGLPWLWLRGSLSGLVLALAFAISIDVAVVTTWIWPGLVELPLVIGLWTAVAAIWLIAMVSATAAFPPPIPLRLSQESDRLFVEARNAYLAHDWMGAEERLRQLLGMAPTDGEAQLLLGTLLRRTGRSGEAKRALEQLSRSDSGGPWRSAIADELARLESDEPPVILPAREESPSGQARAPAA